MIARALEKGADDYIVKPFSLTELMAMIQAALRRRQAPSPAQPTEPYVRGDLTIDYAERLVRVAGRPVHLTAIEYGLLFEPSVHGGRVEIIITEPTAIRGGFDIGKLQQQIGEIDNRRQEFLGRNVDARTVSFAQRILEAMVADFGWLDGGVSVVAKEPGPITISLSFRFQRREAVSGEWSSWHALNLNNEGEGLELEIWPESLVRGDVFRQ